MIGRRFWQDSKFGLPLLRRLAARARRQGRDDGAAESEVAGLLPGRIRLRSFAGAAAYAQQLTTRLKVVHLTDLHVGRVTPMRVQRAAVALANAQHPDLVAITGDFVCYSQEYLDALEEVVGAIEAPVIGVLGNHDHWSGAAEVRRALKRAGAEVLDNAHTILTLRGERLQILGLDDAYTGHADQERAARGLSKTLPVLGLSHIAEEADGLWRRGVPLVLSGHTHAGQVTLAGLHELSIGRWVGHKYVHGLYGSRTPSEGTEAGAVYVGAGIGASLVPLRLGERGRREVTVFELGAMPGSIDEQHQEQEALPGRPPTAKQKRRRAALVVKNAARRARRGKAPRRH